MKGFVAFLCSGLLVLLMLVAPGTAAFAHEVDGEQDDCGCGVTYVEGAERNKIVANTLKLTEFRVQKANLKAQGYTFMGASQIQVVRMPNPQVPEIVHTIVAIPFVNSNGELLMAGFTDGVFMGAYPPDIH